MHGSTFNDGKTRYLASVATFEEIIPCKDKIEYQINQLNYGAHKVIRRMYHDEG
jgi:hypothetical protein